MNTNWRWEVRVALFFQKKNNQCEDAGTIECFYPNRCSQLQTSSYQMQIYLVLGSPAHGMGHGQMGICNGRDTHQTHMKKVRRIHADEFIGKPTTKLRAQSSL